MIELNKNRFKAKTIKVFQRLSRETVKATAKSQTRRKSKKNKSRNRNK